MICEKGGIFRAGMTSDYFTGITNRWLRTVKYLTMKNPYMGLVNLMLELLENCGYEKEWKVIYP